MPCLRRIMSISSRWGIVLGCGVSSPRRLLHDRRCLSNARRQQPPRYVTRWRTNHNNKHTQGYNLGLPILLFVLAYAVETRFQSLYIQNKTSERSDNLFGAVLWHTQRTVAAVADLKRFADSGWMKMAET